MPRRRRPGRPPKPPGLQKIQYVKIYLTEDQRRQIKTRAAEAKLKMSDYGRACMLSSDPVPVQVPTVNLDALRQLSGMANNLNQLTRHLHGGGELVEVHEEFVGLVDELRSLIHDWKNPAN